MKKIEFGDFQTTPELAKICTELIRSKPNTVIEPTCGLGAFLKSAENKWSKSDKIGIEINNEYLAQARLNLNKNTKLINHDILSFNWDKELSKLKSPVLFIGNPPWVTNSKQGQFEGKNLPQKDNSQNLSGISALTGKSNFDISEVILINLIQSAYNNLKSSEFAFLIKSSVARKLFLYLNQNNYGSEDIRIYKIDSNKWFKVSVDACLFHFKLNKEKPIANECIVFEYLNQNSKSVKIGIVNNRLVANLELYEKSKKYFQPNYEKWRSGIKHDASKVLELTKNSDGSFTNGFDKIVKIEETFLYPLYKSSDLTKNTAPRKYLIVTQKTVGEDTSKIKQIAPKTYQYLMSKKSEFKKRKSSIYKKAPDFGIFGVGEYSFSKWKIAISGLLKETKFKLVKPYQQKPVVFDDTCYFLSFNSLKEAKRVFKIINSKTFRDALNSFIFFDAKRPITAELLNQIAIQLIKEK